MCSIEECERPTYCKGLCVMHYQRVRRHGDPSINKSAPPQPTPNPALLSAINGARAMDLPTRPGFERLVGFILERCEPGEEGCWLWTGTLDNHGYGRVGRLSWAPPISTLVHRALYAGLVETPHPALHLDHLCRHRACCNPGHLDLVLPKVNLTRGVGKVAQLARAKFCIAGHPFDEANTYITPPWRPDVPGVQRQAATRYQGPKVGAGG